MYADHAKPPRDTSTAALCGATPPHPNFGQTRVDAAGLLLVPECLFPAPPTVALAPLPFALSRCALWDVSEQQPPPSLCVCLLRLLAEKDKEFPRVTPYSGVECKVMRGKQTGRAGGVGTRGGACAVLVILAYSRLGSLALCLCT